MKSSGIWFGFLIIIVIVFGFWIRYDCCDKDDGGTTEAECCDKHFVDVYINSKCDLVTLDNDQAIPLLLIFPGDFVIWNNLSEGLVTLNLPEGWFEVDYVEIPIGQRVILELIKEEVADGSVTIGGTCGSAAPALKIGDEP